MILLTTRSVYVIVCFLQGLSTGMLVLGVVKQIQTQHLLVSLPNGLCGKVELSNVCAAYSTLLQKLIREEIDPENEDIGSLQDLFHVGQAVRCKVISIGSGGKKGKTRILLSVDPSQVNIGLSPTLLKNGMVIMICL